jgi:hypothetical protein
MTGNRTTAAKDSRTATRKPGLSGRAGQSDARFGLQDALGNRGVLNRLRRPTEPSPTPAPPVIPVSIAPAELGVQRKCSGCGGGGGMCSACAEEKEEFPIQRKARSGGGGERGVSAVPASGSTGRPLDGGTRGFMESRFGHDFGGVRVHSDGRAASAADTLKAHAFTVGQDVYFAAGRYRPDTHDGRHLLAHELTHTLQQRAAAPSGAGGSTAQARRSVSQPGDPLEREADSVADRVLSGTSSFHYAPSPAAPSIQRYSVGDFIDDVKDAGEAVADTAKDVAGDVKDIAVDVATSVKDTAVDVATSVKDTAVDVATSVKDVATDVKDIAVGVATDVKDFAVGVYEDAVSFARAIGGMVSISSAGIEINVPSFPACPTMAYRFNLPEWGGYLLSLKGAIPVGPDLILTGEVGVHAGVTPEISFQIGPCLMHGIHILVNPLTGSFSGSGAMTAAVGVGLGGEARIGLGGSVGAAFVVPGLDIPVEIPVLDLSAGLAGFVRGMAFTSVTAGGRFASSIGSVSLKSFADLTLGLAADLGAAGYGSLELFGMNLCRMYWPFVTQHNDIVLTAGISVALEAGLSGISADIDVRPPAVSPLKFADLPVALSRDIFHDDCPLCGALYRLGWMPSQRGGDWKGYPPDWPGPLADVHKRVITSGAKCRGACGPDCETCKNKPLEYACEDTGDGSHVIWVYPNYSVCPTAQGCRDHDACYDWYVAKGEKSIWGLGHRLCDFECLCGHGVPQCVGWIRGRGGDATAVFSDEPRSLGACQGTCPDKEPTDDPNHFKFCLPEFELLQSRRFFTPLLNAATDEVPLVTIPVPVPYIGEIPVTIAVRAFAKGDVSGGLGPLRVTNACLVPDLAGGGYKGTGEVHLLADATATLELTGRLSAIAGWRCLVEVARADGDLIALGHATLTGDLAAKGEIACRNGEVGLAGSVDFTPCLELGGQLDVALHVKVFGFEVYTDRWNLGKSDDWKQCWPVEITTFTLGLGGAGAGLLGGASALASGLASAGGGAGGLSSGAGSVMPTDVHVSAPDPDSQGILKTLIGIATNNAITPADAPADPAAAAHQENPCGNVKPDDQCGSKRLPITRVDWPKGTDRGRYVVAHPLTKCRGNTIGSPASYRFPAWSCIRAAKEENRWGHTHLLHDQLHGPGREPWNLIITSKSINGRVQEFEHKAVDLTQAGKTLTYNAVVNGYWSDDEGTQRSFIATELFVGYQQIDPETEAPIGPPQGDSFEDWSQAPPGACT